MTIDAPIQSQRLATAQAAVLGAMLIDADCIADVLADTSEMMFVSSAYRTVYGCIRQLFQEAQPVDPVTVGAALKERAGQDYGELLVQLMDVTPTSANVGSYVEILKRESIVWRLRSIGAALAETEDLRRRKADGEGQRRHEPEVRRGGLGHDPDVGELLRPPWGYGEAGVHPLGL